MTQGRIRNHAYLFRKIADGIKTFGREVGRCVPVKQVGDHFVMSVELIHGNQIDKGRAGAERTAERALSAVSSRRVLHHII